MGVDPRILTYAEAWEDYVLERSDPDWEPVRLGFGSLDAEIRGVAPGQVLGIAAYTGIGKTWLMETIIHNFSARKDRGQVSLSLEMPASAWVERAVAIQEDIAPEQVEASAIQGDRERGRRMSERLQHALLIEDMVALNELPAVIARTREMLTVPLRLVTIDYLGLLGVTGKNAYERASEIGVGLMNIAKTERVSIIVAVQLSRAGADASKPVTDDMIRDSGVISQSLSFTLGCWRPGEAEGLTDEEADEHGDTLTVGVIKNRNGVQGRRGRWVDLRFHPLSRRLYEPADPFVALR